MPPFWLVGVAENISVSDKSLLCQESAPVVEKQREEYGKYEYGNECGRFSAHPVMSISLSMEYYSPAHLVFS